MRLSHLVALAFATALALWALAGCGQPPPEEGGGRTASETTGETTSETTGEETTVAEALSPGEGTLVVYSGRSEELVGPIFEQFEERSGVDVQVRYGDTAELAATILEEGDNSPADLFFAQDPGALGALDDEGRLTELPREILDRVPPRFRADDGDWVGTSGRARVVAYNTDELAEADLPDSILDFTDPEWGGRIGWAPTNGSFQAFVTALRELEGEEGAREWLEGIQANDPFAYPDNLTAIEGVASGEVDVAFVNHYYLYQVQEERGGDVPVANYYLQDGDPGALVLAAGAGVLDSAENPRAAESFLEFALSQEAQQYFADETVEYPLVEGVEIDEELVPLDQIQSPEIDLSDLDDLQGTLELLRETGVL
ncbi:MAG TPA: iron ABC transporter substrate-binding protein [Rubrobacteraceae bacterium]|nr:iron ABC transporter substrate-binding protein [Rubrobacteraceae bacterium]